MKTYPDQNYYYNIYHYWLRPHGDILYVGVTPNYIDEKYEVYAVYFEQTSGFAYQKDQVGCFSAEAADEEFGEMFGFRMPLSGHILECNSRFIDEPRLWRENPYIGGWLFQMKPEHPEELKTLMNAAAYAAFVSP